MVDLLVVILFIYCLANIGRDSADKSFWNRSGMRLYTDAKTGLQYVGGGMFGGIVPRLNRAGNHMKEGDPR